MLTFTNWFASSFRGKHRPVLSPRRNTVKTWDSACIKRTQYTQLQFGENYNCIPVIEHINSLLQIIIFAVFLCVYVCTHTCMHVYVQYWKMNEITFFFFIDKYQLYILMVDNIFWYMCQPWNGQIKLISMCISSYFFFFVVKSLKIDSLSNF